MKNQYFGDVNDYLKYGLLRQLSNEGRFKICVCWMLTEPDGTTEGGKTKYLNQENKYRHFDPILFDYLSAMINTQQRKVWSMPTDLLPSTIFHSDLLTDRGHERLDYFQKLRQIAVDAQLIFFDPDNGLEIKSVQKGRKRSSKFVYWDELSEVYRQKKSILLFQHFRRIKHEPFISEMASEMRARLGIESVISLRTNNVVYFLLPQPEHLPGIMKSMDHLQQNWGDKFQVQLF